ncbi:hypothetical protein J4208_04235 [Candidatus Woesearchaeota archaeon]|nr:hypothetical protein [Candidatus Woesearchaeota archaeon]
MVLKYKEVKMGRISTACYPCNIETFGITNCVGLGILNHKLRKGYVGHHFPLVKTPEELIDRALREAKNIGDLEIALAGNIPLSKEITKIGGVDFRENLESYREHKRWLLEMVKRKGINLSRIQDHLQTFPSRNDYALIVDTTKRIIVVKKESY